MWNFHLPRSLVFMFLVQVFEKENRKICVFYNLLNNGFAVVKRESHMRFDLSRETDNSEKDRFFTAEMWYFPHECMKVDHIDM